MKKTTNAIAKSTRKNYASKRLKRLQPGTIQGGGFAMKCKQKVLPSAGYEKGLIARDDARM